MFPRSRYDLVEKKSKKKKKMRRKEIRIKMRYNYTSFAASARAQFLFSLLVNSFIHKLTSSKKHLEEKKG